MKDFPLDELLAATDLDKIQEAVYLIFAHINKKLKLSYVAHTTHHRTLIIDLTRSAGPFLSWRRFPETSMTSFCVCWAANA